jgi:retinol dehydrogenase 12
VLSLSQVILPSNFLILGANVGLGLEVSRQLARFNPKKLILACRNQEKGSKAVNSICETTNVAKGVVEAWELDLANFESVKAFAKKGHASSEHLTER